MIHTKQKGDVSETQVLAHLIKQGYTVLVPFGENQRYDLVIEDEFQEFERIQVKTGRIRNGALLFATSSLNPYNRVHRGYAGEIDVFYIYCPDNDKIYRIPIKDVAKGAMSLRLLPTKNCQQAGIRWAKDFLVPN